MSVKIHYGKIVKDMECTDLLKYLSNTVPDQVLEAIHRGQVSGADWAWTLARMETIEQLKAEIGDIGAFQLAKLKREAQETNQGLEALRREVEGRPYPPARNQTRAAVGMSAKQPLLEWDSPGELESATGEGGQRQPRQERIPHDSGVLQQDQTVLSQRVGGLRAVVRRVAGNLQPEVCETDRGDQG